MKPKKLFRLLAVFFVTFSIFTNTVSAHASGPKQVTPWCGSTSETENYGFTMPLDQYHWTVNGDKYVSSAAIDEVDQIYDLLNADNIANTMILFMDESEVSIGPSCAGHFLMYMQLGNIDGPRMANGMAILFTVTEDDGQFTRVKVNYSVGGSLNALLPDGLMEMDRIAQNTFSTTNSLTETYLTVLRYFEQYARSKYEPYHPPTTTPNTQVSDSNNQSSPLRTVFICLLCLVLLIIAFVTYQLLFGGNTQTKNRRNDDDFTYGGTDQGTGYKPSNSPAPRPSYPKPNYAPAPRPSAPKPSSPAPRPTPPPSRRGGGSGNTSRTG